LLANYDAPGSLFGFLFTAFAARFFRAQNTTFSLSNSVYFYAGNDEEKEKKELMQNQEMGCPFVRVLMRV